MKPGSDSSEQSLEYAEGRKKQRGGGSCLSRSLPCFQRFLLTLEVLLTLWSALVFEGWWLGPPLKRKVGNFSGALAQHHTPTAEQNPLQLNNSEGNTAFSPSNASGDRTWKGAVTTHTSRSSLPSFRPHCSAGDPALTWLTKMPVLFPPTIVMSSARPARLCFGEVGGLEVAQVRGLLRDMEAIKRCHFRWNNRMETWQKNSASNPSLMCVYLGTSQVESGEETSGMWTRSGGKRCELREFQESHREDSLGSTGNTTAVR